MRHEDLRHCDVPLPMAESHDYFFLHTCSKSHLGAVSLPPSKHAYKYLNIYIIFKLLFALQ